MALKRVIPCLDVDAGRVVKGTNFVGLRDAGDPVELAARYDAEGADELVFLDITASHEKRDTITELARRTADNVFIPFTIGGGIRSVEDAQAVLDAGADKVAVNSSALARPDLISELADVFGVAVRGDRDRRQARRGDRLRRLRKRRADAGRGPRGRRLGARGDRARGGGGAADEHGPRRDDRRLRPRAHPRGRRRGRVPVIASGGVGELGHLVEGVTEGGADAVLCRLDLPLRQVHHRRGEGGDARGRDRRPGLARRP